MYHKSFHPYKLEFECRESVSAWLAYHGPSVSDDSYKYDDSVLDQFQILKTSLYEKKEQI